MCVSFSSDSTLYNTISQDYHTGFYNFNGHIPWNDIAANPLHHLAKRSQPNSDHKLEEPSHMKSDGVDSWLKHWLRLQKRNKHPLVLKARTDKTSETHLTPTIASKSKGKKKAHYIESDESDDFYPVDEEDEEDDSQTDAPVTPSGTGKGKEPVTHSKTLPPSPQTAALTRKTCRTFLATLSDDGNYKKLLLLLCAAKVSSK
jgi:hypothetical protein